MARPLAQRIRRLPGAKAAARLVPRPTTRLLGTRPLDANRAALSPAFEEHLRSLLRDDVRQLRTYLGERFDGWDIA